jgi:pimeloyl-ACP methyl ester carboxylesterase
MTITRSLLSILPAIALLACSASPKSVTTTTTPPPPAAGSFVLVHGAWMGAWSWEVVATRLRAQGANVVSVELPGHGADRTPVSETSLDAYIAAVTTAVDASSGQVVLVGHSMAGIVISAVAAQRADKLAGVVYLAAYVPKAGETLQAIAGTDAASHVGAALQIDAQTGVARIARDKLRDIFCADCPADAAAQLAAQYRDEPLPAFGAPVPAPADAWAKVARFYIYTTQDRAVSYELQQRMTAGLAWAGTETVESGHAPFLSKPDVIVAALARFAAR